MVNASTDEIAVIQTRLPYTDHRALSEAWFSALHVASEHAGEEANRRSAQPEEPLSAPLSRMRPKDASQEKQGGAVPAWRSPPPARRRDDCGVVCAAESARVRRASAPGAVSEESRGEKISHVSFTMTVAGVRTALHVRRDGGKLIVIALCSARHAELVRRALAEAAAGLRSQGERVATAVRAVDGEDRA
jgi:hypothetical protein